MSELEVLRPRWDGPCIVAATGESLTKEVAAICVASKCAIIVIKQAALRLPTADVLYACDAAHWNQYKGYPEFQNERWSSHGRDTYDNKLDVAKKYGLRLVRGAGIREPQFSSDPSVIYYGNSTGFQAIGLAVHWLRKPGRIGLVGFDFQGGYFYGHHPRWSRNTPPFHAYISSLSKAAECLPEGVEIFNCSEKSALRCFPMMPLEEFLSA